MDPNIMLMIIIKYLIRSRNEPMRYAEITRKKVISMFYLYLRYKKLQDKKDRAMWVRDNFRQFETILFIILSMSILYRGNGTKF